MSLGSQISFYRKKAGITQAQLADAMGVSFQAVSSWEHDDYSPDVSKLQILASALNTSVSRLLDEMDLPDWEWRRRFFNPEHMYYFIQATALSKKLYQTTSALPFIKKTYHSGKNSDLFLDDYASIDHPLTIACEALVMGVDDDNIVASLLLHDILSVSEITVKDLPFSPPICEIVELISRYPSTKDERAKSNYYKLISEKPSAAFVLCMDRLNTLASLAMTSGRKDTSNYIAEIEKYVVPLFQMINERESKLTNPVWLLRYHMYSLLELYKHLL